MNTETSQEPNNRRSRTRKEIKQLITERNSVLSKYYNLASHADQRDDNDNPDDVLEMLQEFCQELVDYMATGHFEIYRRIEDGDERRTDMIKLADEIFPHITNTTQIAIDFNDLYDASKDIDKSILESLTKQLSVLGENLATRIDLEDKFIDKLLSTPPKLSAVSA